MQCLSESVWQLAVWPFEWKTWNWSARKWCGVFHANRRKINWHKTIRVLFCRGKCMLMCADVLVKQKSTIKSIKYLFLFAQTKWCVFYLNDGTIDESTLTSIICCPFQFKYSVIITFFTHSHHLPLNDLLLYVFMWSDVFSPPMYKLADIVYWTQQQQRQPHLSKLRTQISHLIFYAMMLNLNGIPLTFWQYDKTPRNGHWSQWIVTHT